MTDDQWTSASKDLLIAEIHRLQGERNDLARRSAPEAAEPVAQSWWCRNCSSATPHSMRSHDLCCDACHFITATRHAAPTDSQAGRDAVDAARYRWLRDVSTPPHNFYLSVPVEFDGIKYSRDEVDAAIDAALSTTAGRAE